MNTELAACPFCGGSGLLTVDPGDMSVGIGESYWSGCAKCEYSIPFRNEDDAVKWWNTRSLEDTLRAEIILLQTTLYLKRKELGTQGKKVNT